MSLTSLVHHGSGWFVLQQCFRLWGPLWSWVSSWASLASLCAFLLWSASELAPWRILQKPIWLWPLASCLLLLVSKLCLSYTKHSAWNWGLSKASCPSGYRPFCWYELDFCSVKFCSFFCSVKVWKLLQKCKRSVHLKEPRFLLCGFQTTFLSDPRSVCHHWSVCVCQHAGHKLLDVHNQHVPGNAECPE